MSQPAATKQSPSTSTVSRLAPLDALRGLIIVLMAIDHAGYFIAHRHTSEYWGLPQPQFESALAFFTRFVTHFSAPGFFFLMGVGIVLLASSRRRSGWDERSVKKYLLLRGAFLIALQIFVDAPAWLLGPTSQSGGANPPGGGDPFFLYFGILYGLGAVMIVASLLMDLNAWFLIGIGAAATLLTQWVVPNAQVGVLYSPLIRLLLIPGHTDLVLVIYPMIPWLGVTLFGVIFGQWILRRPDAVARRAGTIGVAMLALFFLVRAGNGFGNINPVAGSGWMNFLALTKYPPSLSFLLLTLGGNLLLLAAFFRLGETMTRWAKPLIVFGQAPLFFYLIHLYLFGLVGKFLAPTNGTSLPVMYLYWLGALIVLYPACLWYGKFKRSTPPESLWRFL